MNVAEAGQRFRLELEDELQVQLDLARTAVQLFGVEELSVVHPAIRRSTNGRIIDTHDGVNARVREAELAVVEDVKGFHAELDVLVFLIVSKLVSNLKRDKINQRPRPLGFGIAMSALSQRTRCLESNVPDCRA